MGWQVLTQQFLSPWIVSYTTVHVREKKEFNDQFEVQWSEYSKNVMKRIFCSRIAAKGSLFALWGLFILSHTREKKENPLRLRIYLFLAVIEIRQKSQWFIIMLVPFFFDSFSLSQYVSDRLWKVFMRSRSDFLAWRHWTQSSFLPLISILRSY